ncbi:FtsL-like putative cell division protein [Pedobacter sp. UBA4863]|uniref:FtsL-like putative cell division protein n=1 Tax=Pedobacter sp. UBA4863 TaxID=1947060 RepID=UPI0025D28FCB|nr:FtsL-like putative cell division protein [Pedobacter sp. UBA4863]
MSNRFKEKIEEELAEEEDQLPEEPNAEEKEPKKKEGSVSAFFRKLFVEGAVSKEAATDMLPYLIFLCVLGMVYIANSHMAVKRIRDIDRLSKEVKELSWEYKSLKADLMFKSKMTEVAKKVDTLGLEELIEPPKKIIVPVK